jgi:hypothetical protein
MFRIAIYCFPLVQLHEAAPNHTAFSCLENNLGEKVAFSIVLDHNEKHLSFLGRGQYWGLNSWPGTC